MAKRRRLGPADPGLLGGAPETKGFVNGWQGARTMPPPVAQVAGAAAAEAALAEVTEEMARARAEGRLVQALPLDAIDEAYLVRDRVAIDAEDFAALVESLRARGQQTPIEVVDLGGGRYGLISGLRRLKALRELARDGEAQTVLAAIRAPKDAAAAYVAMVEENEIRAPLSFYEKARIVARAVEQGVYPDVPAALRGLYGALPKARRSKIGSFVGLYRALDGALSHPEKIPEHLGLALVRRLAEDDAAAGEVVARLAGAEDAAAERAVLEAVARPPKSVSDKAGKGFDEAEEIAPGIRFEARRGRVVLSGPGVDAALANRLRALLAREA